MATFSPSYFEAGKGSAVKLPELDLLEKSQQRAGDLAIKGAEMQLNKSLQDKDRFMKMLSIDPVAAISDQNMRQQAADLEKYNNTWAKKYVEGKGQLSTADEIQMASDKRMLQMKQEKMLSDQKQWEYANNVIDKDTRGYYDRDAFVNATKEYFDKGTLPSGLLQVAPQDIRPLLAKDPNQSAFTQPMRLPITDTNGNVVGYQNGSTEFKRSKQEAQEAIFDKLQHEPVLKSVIKDFESQPENVQYEALKSYDANGDHKIDPAEKQYAYQHMDLRDNPIVKWAMNHPDYITASMGANPAVPKNIPQGKSGGSNAPSLNIGGQTVKMLPGKQVDGQVTYGDKNYIRPYSFGAQKLGNVPTQNGTLISSDGTEEKLEPGTMEGNLLHYDPAKDVLIFSAASATNNPYLKSNDIVEVPASNLSGANDLPILINGKMGKVGDLRKGIPPVKKKAY